MSWLGSDYRRTYKTKSWRLKVYLKVEVEIMNGYVLIYFFTKKKIEETFTPSTVYLLESESHLRISFP